MDANSAAEPLGESSPPTPLTQQQVQGLKHFKTLLPLFQHLHDVGCARDRAGNRQLFFDDYCAAAMLYLLNPLIGSMRSLQHVLSLPNVARKLGVKRFSLGSFSEAQAVFEPQRLLAVIEELAGQARPLAKDPRLSQLKQTLTLVDGTALNGLVRLVQAGVDGGGDEGKRPAAMATTNKMTAATKKSFKKAAQQGWRLHTQLELDAIAPLRIDVTRGTKGDNHESHVLRKALAGGRCYVFDAGLADRLLFDDIHAIASTYVGRIRETSVFEVVEERLLDDAALAANVVRDAVVTLGVPGASPMNHAVRIVAVQVTPHPRRTRKGTKSTRTSDLVVIATNILDLPPELIALIYLYRYTVELFFRLFKHLLGMRHLLSQKKNGVKIQTYLAVIACLLIGLQTGRRPDKRTVEMVGWYLLGLASEQDVIAHLNKPDNRGVKLRAKAELWKKLGY
jgi:hypothetical protein